MEKGCFRSGVTTSERAKGEGHRKEGCLQKIN
jgi:hypothetical protein